MPDSNPGSNYDGWHFLSGDRRIATYRNADGRISAHSGKLVTPGLTLTVPGPVCPGAFGLHASENPATALFFACGLVACRVRLSGRVVRADVYAAASDRTVLWMGDAGDVVWDWFIRSAITTARHAETSGYRLDCVVWDGIAAREMWLQAVRAEQARSGVSFGAATQAQDLPILRAMAQLRAVEKPLRKVWLRVENRRNHGRGIPKTIGYAAPLPVQHATGQAKRLCATNPGCVHVAAARPAGWFASDMGKAEGADLERALMALPNKEME